MGGRNQVGKFTAQYYKDIKQIEPYFLEDDDMRVDFLATVEKLRKAPQLRLDKQAMLLRPPSSYHPTSQGKLDKLLESDVNVYAYYVKHIKNGYYELQRYEWYTEKENGEAIGKMEVKKLISKDLEVYV